MKKRIFILFIVLISLGNVFAYSDENYSLDFILNNKEDAVDIYNRNLDRVPEIIKDQFSNEVISLEVIRDDNSTEVLYLILKDSKLEEISTESRDDISLELYMSESSIDSIIQSEDKVAELKSAMKSKDIVLKPKDFFNSIKIGIMKVILFFIG
jgi:non-homologous end joining protein Ku